MHAAAIDYEQIVNAHADDSRSRLAFGEALLRDQKFARACRELERLKDKDLGARPWASSGARMHWERRRGTCDGVASLDSNAFPAAVSARRVGVCCAARAGRFQSAVCNDAMSGDENNSRSL
jgi:hypothetical protein